MLPILHTAYNLLPVPRTRISPSFLPGWPATTSWKPPHLKHADLEMSLSHVVRVEAVSIGRLNSDTFPKSLWNQRTSDLFAMEWIRFGLLGIGDSINRTNLRISLTNKLACISYLNLNHLELCPQAWPKLIVKY